MDKYQEELFKFLKDYAQNANMSWQHALRDILGDLQIVANVNGLDFTSALVEIE